MSVDRAESGSTIGTYVLERKLGAGGMAEVYLARRSGPRGFTKRVAIKRILPELSEDSQLIQMFCDEARVAATLSHPNIAQVLEFGEHEGELYIVMEYVDGVSSSALIRAAAGRGETIPVGSALYIAHEVLLALSFAHEVTDEAGTSLGLVHRDVSPSNVLVSRTGNVKLIDFGITRSFLAERRTFPGELKGKLRYMSPEQILGADIDARSDLFAVGVVLAEMLVGRALFSGKSDLDVLTRISRGDLGVLKDGQIPRDLLGVLEVALAHRPGNRFQTAREFATKLEDVAQDRGFRLDDTTTVPYLHALGILPSSSGTRLSAGRIVPPPPSPLPPVEGRRSDSITPPAPQDLSARLVAACAPTGPPPALLTQPKRVPSLVTRAVVAPPNSRRPSGAYRVRTRSGNIVGPLPQAEMLALLATGRLSARSHVSLKADSFVTVDSVPALSTLASHPAYRFREDDAASPDWLARVEAVAIPNTLYRLAISRASGLLLAVDGKRRKRIFFDKGDPVFVASTDRDELLGRRLVASRTVSESSIKLALASQPPFRLGEALVSSGALGAAQLVRELSRQLEDRVAALGSWRSGELRFFSDTVLDESLHVIRTREPTLSVLTRIVREEYTPGDIAALLRPFTKETLTPGAEYAALTPLLGLTPSETSVLALAEHEGTVRDIVTRAAQNGAAMAEALRAIFIALCSGALVAEGWAKAGAA
jgi:serine/threonine protein kinase